MKINLAEFVSRVESASSRLNHPINWGAGTIQRKFLNALGGSRGLEVTLEEARSVLVGIGPLQNMVLTTWIPEEPNIPGRARHENVISVLVSSMTYALDGDDDRTKWLQVASNPFVNSVCSPYPHSYDVAYNVFFGMMMSLFPDGIDRGGIDLTTKYGRLFYSRLREILVALAGPEPQLQSVKNLAVMDDISADMRPLGNMAAAYFDRLVASDGGKGYGACDSLLEAYIVADREHHTPRPCGIDRVIISGCLRMIADKAAGPMLARHARTMIEEYRKR